MESIIDFCAQYNLDTSIKIFNESINSMLSIIDFCAQYNLDDSIKVFLGSFLPSRDLGSEIVITHKYLNEFAHRSESDLITILIDADYFGIDALVEFLTKALANVIKGKNLQELKEEWYRK